MDKASATPVAFLPVIVDAIAKTWKKAELKTYAESMKGTLRGVKDFRSISTAMPYGVRTDLVTGRIPKASAEGMYCKEVEGLMLVRQGLVDGAVTGVTQGASSSARKT